jgi:putative FmdB family regulatory protein
MPLYDFRCPKCGLEFEVSRPMSRSDEPAYCLIDGTQSERMISMPSFFVKGGTGTAGFTDSSAGAGHTHGPGGHTHGPGGHTHGPGGHSHSPF